MCPNCTKEAAGLYTSETGVTHCGCYYEGDPAAVDWHVSTDVGVLDHCPMCGRAIDDDTLLSWDHQCTCPRDTTPARSRDTTPARQDD